MDTIVAGTFPAAAVRHPVSPDCSPSLGVHHDGVGLVDHARDQGLAVLPVHLGHLDHIPAGVSPVDVPGDPVHSDPSRHLEPRDL